MTFCQCLSLSSLILLSSMAAALRCPEGFSLVFGEDGARDTCYLVKLISHANYDEARAICQRSGRMDDDSFDKPHLATIRNQAQLDWLLIAAERLVIEDGYRKPYMWIGLHSANRNKPNGQWRWEMGTSSFTSWAAGQPSLSLAHGEHPACVHLNMETNAYYNVPCSDKFGFVACEYNTFDSFPFPDSK